MIFTCEEYNYSIYRLHVFFAVVVARTGPEVTQPVLSSNSLCVFILCE